MNFSLSETAQKKLSQTLGKGKFFRIRVDSGGCFGFQYLFSLEDKVDGEDTLFKQEDVRIIIDPPSMPFLEGAQLDYTEEMIGSQFVIHNPKAEQSCGCKNSFSFDL